MGFFSNSMLTANNIFTCIRHHLEGAGGRIKIIGAPAILHQNLPLPYRADIIFAFSDNHFITAGGGSVVVCCPGNRRLSILIRDLYLAG